MPNQNQDPREGEFKQLYPLTPGARPIDGPWVLTHLGSGLSVFVHTETGNTMPVTAVMLAVR